jgi:hypothetical protein
MNRQERRFRNKLFNRLKSKCKVKTIPVSELLNMPYLKTPNPMFDRKKFIQSLDNPNFDFSVNEICCLCNTKITDFRDSHNPHPLTKNKEDRCCSKCNNSKVMHARLFESAHLDERDCLI